MIEVDQVVRARDWENTEGKMFVVRELFTGRWGPSAWVHVLEWGARTVPISRVIPIDHLTVDEEETARYREWRAGRDQ